MTIDRSTVTSGWNIPNQKHPASNLITGGAPEISTLELVAAAGVRHIVDLRPKTEWTYDEGAEVRSLGMSFHHLPIAGLSDMTLNKAQDFDQLLAHIGEDLAIVHCASGNRVGAMMALRAGWLEKASVVDALAIGRAHGLTKMEQGVRAML